MKRIGAGILLLFSLDTVAETLPGDPETWVQSIRDMVKTERVLLKKSPGSDKTNIVLTIPAPELLAESGGLSKTGRQVVASADAYAKQAGSKLKVLLPEEKPGETIHDCSGPAAGKNGLADAYVYIFIKK